MPKPAKAMRNPKSDTLVFLSFSQFWSQTRKPRIPERYPMIPKTPKVEKAKGNLKCWMVTRVNRGFDSNSHIIYTWKYGQYYVYMHIWIDIEENICTYQHLQKNRVLLNLTWMLLIVTLCRISNLRNRKCFSQFLIGTAGELPNWFIQWTKTGWRFQKFNIVIPIWGNDPVWLIFFRWVETTN